MTLLVKRIPLGLFLIAGASAVLLISDWERCISGSPVPAQGNRPRKLRMIEFNNVLDVEETEQGFFAELRVAGWVEGRAYEMKIANAQGDMATLSGLVDAAVEERADLLVTLSVPALQAALARGKGRRIVFTYVGSGVVAGAGRTDEDHLPYVTGVYLQPAYEEMLRIVRRCLPGARVLGTLFVPSEVNSVLQKDLLEVAARKAGLKLDTVAASTAVDVSDAALALCSRKIDAVCQVMGNLTASSFAAIGRAARNARLPVFAFQSTQAEDGASVVLARDNNEAGRLAARLVIRVFGGDSPAAIPFQLVQRTRLIVNLEAARAVGLVLPPDVIGAAEKVIGQ